ncbi:MAG: hypothetical protein HYU31_17615 [Deltaproteobacteria bacterium]|nr:hypothetical protein [Deltaproteobacteria bacterium]
MKARAIATRGMRVQLSKRLYRRVEQAARLTKCHFSKVIAAALESSLPLMPEELPRKVAEEVAGWTLLDNEALRAIAGAFLPTKQQRRFTLLLRKQEVGDLSARERTEWEALQQEYLRVSQNKAKAQYLLAQREKARAT